MIPTPVPTPILTPDEINELMKDWFVRDGETYTHITEEHKLAWEPTSDTAYSTFLLGKYTNKEVIVRNAYKLASNLIVAMNLPCKWKLFLDPSRNCTDGRSIWLATKVFDDKKSELSNGERVDVFLGLAAHEAAHILYTDFSIKSDEKKYKRYELDIIHQIDNILEDERIERLLGYHKPGTVRFIEKTKYYMFEEIVKNLEKEEEKSIEEGGEVNELTKAINLLLKIIRYPKYLTENEIIEFGTKFKDIKDVLTPYPEYCIDVRVASEKIWDILKDLLSAEIKSKLEESADAEEALEKALEELVKTTVEAIKEAIEKVLKAGSLSSPEEGTEMPDDTAEDFGTSKLITDALSKMLLGEMEKGELDKTFFHHITEPDKRNYEESYRRIARYIPAVKKALKYHSKDYQVVHKSMRSGVLDTDKIVEACMDVPTVYKNYGHVKTENVAVCFLIDESGSMGGKKIEAARDTAILMYEALKDNPSLELYIYGHTADLTGASTDIRIYHEKGMKPNKYKLGSRNLLWQNRDGYAIKECALRIRKKTNKKCLMFVLSDGAPCAYDYDENGITDTRKKVTEVQRMGFDVVQIAIENHYDPSLMFDHFVKFTDLSKLPKDLNVMMKKTLLKKQRVITT